MFLICMHSIVRSIVCTNLQACLSGNARYFTLFATGNSPYENEGSANESLYITKKPGEYLPFRYFSALLRIPGFTFSLP